MRIARLSLALLAAMSLGTATARAQQVGAPLPLGQPSGPASPPGPTAAPGPMATPGPMAAPGPTSAPGPTAPPGPMAAPGPGDVPGPMAVPQDATPAAAPSASPTAEIGVAPLAAPSQQFAAPPPDLTPQAALIGENAPPIKTRATLCVRPVVVDEDETRTWTQLEQLGAAQAGWNAYMEGDFTRAVPVFQRLAKIGHPEAERLMGVVYYLGQGVPQDFARALYWFEKAADQGCFTAFAPTATLYRDGKGTPLDLGKAYMWFNIATSRLPDSVERDALIKERDDVAAQMTDAQIDAAQKRSLAFAAKQVIPPDPEDLPVDYFPARTN